MEVNPPRLYHFPGSFYSQKALLALAEKGIPYLSRVINLGQFENYSEWYMKINAKGQVPVLQDNDKYIADSVNIIKYLDDVYEGSLLMPSLGLEKWTYYQKKLEDIKIEVVTFGTALHPQLVSKCQLPVVVRHKMKQMLISSQRSTKIKELMEKADPSMREIYEKKIAESKEMEDSMQNEETLKKELDKIVKILAEVNDDLKDKEGETWLCGPDFTVADICLAILLQRLKLLGYGADIWENGLLPYVEAYYVRLLLRPSFRKVCVGGAGIISMMRYVFGDIGTIALVLGSITALIGAIWLGLYMVKRK